MSHVNEQPDAAERTRDHGTNSSNPSTIKQYDIDHSLDESATSESSSEDEQAGVKAIEAIARTWSPWSLGLAYFG